MNTFDVADLLEPLGVAVGAFLILGALGVLAGRPWTNVGSVVVVQLVGVVLSVVIGVGLAWLSYTGRRNG
jgi:protein-S-isoprenylcysteine O-methyltransferase Ste14